MPWLTPLAPTPGVPAVEGHRGAVSGGALLGEGEPDLLPPRPVVGIAGEEGDRAGTFVRAGRSDEHGGARTGEPYAEGVAAAAVRERQGGRGGGADRREVGVEDVGRAATAIGAGGSDEEVVAVE